MPYGWEGNAAPSLQISSSLRNQKGQFKKEYIFVNDGSSDNSLACLKSITKKWKNIKIVSQTNKGPASATQRAIDLSTGDYIKLLGGDDVMSENCTKIYECTHECKQ